MNIVLPAMARCELAATYLARQRGENPGIGKILCWGYLNDEFQNWTEEKYLRWCHQVDRVTGGRFNELSQLYKEIGQNSINILEDAASFGSSKRLADPERNLKTYCYAYIERLHHLTADRNESAIADLISAQVIERRDTAWEATIGFMSCSMREDTSSFLWLGHVIGRRVGWEALLCDFFIAEYQKDNNLIFGKLNDG